MASEASALKADGGKSVGDQEVAAGDQSALARCTAVEVVQMTTRGQSLPQSGFTGFMSGQQGMSPMSAMDCACARSAAAIAFPAATALIGKTSNPMTAMTERRRARSFMPSRMTRRGVSWKGLTAICRNADTVSAAPGRRRGR